MITIPSAPVGGIYTNSPSSCSVSMLLSGLSWPSYVFCMTKITRLSCVFKYSGWDGPELPPSWDRHSGSTAPGTTAPGRTGQCSRKRLKIEPSHSYWETSFGPSLFGSRSCCSRMVFQGRFFWSQELLVPELVPEMVFQGSFFFFLVPGAAGSRTGVRGEVFGPRSCWSQKWCPRGIFSPRSYLGLFIPGIIIVHVERKAFLKGGPVLVQVEHHGFVAHFRWSILIAPEADVIEDCKVRRLSTTTQKRILDDGVDSGIVVGFLGPAAGQKSRGSFPVVPIPARLYAPLAPVQGLLSGKPCAPQ